MINNYPKINPNKMKKITLKIAAIVLLCSVVLFGCKKEEAAVVVPPVDECATLLTTIAPDITAAQLLYAAYLVSPTTKCAELKVAVDALTLKVNKCPAVAADAQVKTLTDAGKLLTCPAP
ncbi:MAG: hypothetical protein EAZ15_03500 [Sphingobacteriales bacterium]|nr:MAG: hypothetical protein EAZ15_03500 [Sphingobacteriales bacterium]